jgi:hypothetical protein
MYIEHWLNFQKLNAINTDHYTVATTNTKYGGLCIYVEKDTVTKQLNYCFLKNQPDALIIQIYLIINKFG